jgi:steroid delta-isomerase-like uncharacterized protein
MVEQNKELVRAAFGGLDEVMAAHDRLYHPEWTGHFPGMPPLDLDGHRQYSETMAVAFPDLERTIDDLVAEGDRVVARWTARGTHSGDLMGVPPSGVVATSSGITVFRIADGRIAEEWSESDMLGLLQQLGAIPGGPPPDGDSG